MKTQTLLAPFRKAISQFDMIKDGDKIAVGVSGGKDSLTLLALLKAYQRFSPQKFELLAITIDLGFKDMNFSTVSDWCKQNEINYIMEKTDIAEILFEVRKETNPCSLCAKLRRGILNSTAKKYGCNKVALGHHSEDLVETFLMSMFYESRLNTFLPKTYLSNQDLVVIRPMILVNEKDIKSYAKNLPVLESVCPADRHTKREYIKNLILSINKEVPQVKEHILSALMHPERNGLFDKLK